MLSNKLDRPISLELKIETKNSILETVITWATGSTIFATVQTGAQAYKYTQGSIDTVIGKTVFTIRPFAGLNYNYRINYGGQYYYIESIEEINRGEG